MGPINSTHANRQILWRDPTQHIQGPGPGYGEQFVGWSGARASKWGPGVKAQGAGLEKMCSRCW